MSTTTITYVEFATLLKWFNVATAPEGVEKLLNAEARLRGFRDWSDAYDHEFK